MLVFFFGRIKTTLYHVHVSEHCETELTVMKNALKYYDVYGKTNDHRLFDGYTTIF